MRDPAKLVSADASRPAFWLTVARAAWWLVAAIMVPYFARGIFLLRQDSFTPCFDPAVCTPGEATAYLQAWGLNPVLITELVFAAVAVTVPVVYLAVAVFLIWRGNNLVAVASAALLLLYGLDTGSGSVALGMAGSPWAAAARPAGVLGLSLAATYVLATFPSGRFAPGWGRWVLGAEWLLLTGLALTVSIESGPGAVGLAACFVVGLALQLYRYRRLAGPVERQQLKWGLTGLTGFLLNAVLWLLWVAPNMTNGPQALSTLLLFTPLSLVLLLSLPVTLAIAILRYRLWDIDVLIRRTLIYAGVTAVLTATYFGLVVVLQALAGALTGRGNSALVTVLSTLAIAALFAPLRRRVQDFVDRRFYRRKYDTAQTLAAFAQQARSEVDLDALAAELREAVTDAMQPSHVDLWLR